MKSNSKTSRLVSIDQFRGVAFIIMWVPVSKNRVSASYVLISPGASPLLFGLSPWPFCTVNAPVWLAVMQMAGLLAALSWIGIIFQRSKWRFIP